MIKRGRVGSFENVGTIKTLGLANDWDPNDPICFSTGRSN